MTDQGKPSGRGMARKEAAPVESAVLLMDASRGLAAQVDHSLTARATV